MGRWGTKYCVVFKLLPVVVVVVASTGSATMRISNMMYGGWNTGSHGVWLEHQVSWYSWNTGSHCILCWLGQQAGARDCTALLIAIEMGGVTLLATKNGS